LLGDGRFKKALQEAMEKCIVLCANCHRKHHFEEDQKKTPAQGGG
jgi:L-lysine 2,3-aminomutase